jgi:hypothetical protein
VASYTFKNGTINFGPWVDGWEPDRRDRVTSVKPTLKRIAAARHWLFHNTGAPIDVTAVLVDMAHVLYLLERIADPTSTLNVVGRGNLAGWAWETMLAKDTGVVVTLSISDHGMRIHTRKESCLVGREREIAEAVAQICRPGARVILHGYPGAGKDTIAREVVFSPEVRDQLGLKLQGWLQASTDAIFRAQLVQFFTRNRHEVLLGIPATEQDQQLAAIKAWLSHPDHRDEWFFVVEDASRDCGFKCSNSWTTTI